MDGEEGVWVFVCWGKEVCAKAVNARRVKRRKKSTPFLNEIM